MFSQGIGPSAHSRALQYKSLPEHCFGCFCLPADLVSVAYQCVALHALCRFDPSKLQFMQIEEVPLAPEAACVGLDIRVVGNDRLVTKSQPNFCVACCCDVLCSALCVVLCWCYIDIFIVKCRFCSRVRSSNHQQHAE